MMVGGVAVSHRPTCGAYDDFVCMAVPCVFVACLISVFVYREVVPLSWQLKCSSMSSRALPTRRYETDCQVSRGWGGR